jgi:predicted MFS family arabinose efflux permease
MNERVKNARIDFLGAISMTIGVVVLLLALTAVGDGASWTAPDVLIGLAVSLVCIGLFLLIERHAVEPIVPLRLFRNRTLSVVTVMLFLFGAGMFGVTIYTPLFVQGVLGQTATGSGTVLLPLVLTMSVSGIFVGQMIGRLGSLRTFIMAGMGLFTLGAFLLSTMGTETSSLLIGVYLFIAGVGLGLVMPLTTLAVQTASSQSDLGAATSMTQFIRSIGSTVGTTVVAWLVTSGYTSHLRTSAPTDTPSSLLSSLASPNALTSSSARSALEAAARAAGKTDLVEPLLAAARSALSMGIHNGLLFVSGCSLLAVIVAALLPHITIKTTPEDKAMQPEDESVSAHVEVTP